MRTVKYDCFENGVLMKTMVGWQEAINWINAKEGREFTVRLENREETVSDKTREAREKRIKRFEFADVD